MHSGPREHSIERNLAETAPSTIPVGRFEVKGEMYKCAYKFISHQFERSHIPVAKDADHSWTAFGRGSNSVPIALT